MTHDTSTRARFIETASRLFEAKGYYSVGLNEILKESKAPKGSLYYHFPGGKEELGIAAIEYARKKIINHMLEIMADYDNPIEALEANFIHMSYLVDNNNKLKDMSIGLIALETYGSNENLRKKCCTVFNDMEMLYAEKLTNAGMDKEKSHTKALLIVASAEGAILLSLARQDGEPLRTLAKNVREIINLK